MPQACHPPAWPPARSRSLSRAAVVGIIGIFSLGSGRGTWLECSKVSQVTRIFSLSAVRNLIATAVVRGLTRAWPGGETNAIPALPMDVTFS
jgi:hypothetical protein